MSRGRGDGNQKSQLWTWILVLVTYGNNSLRKPGSSYLGGEQEAQESSVKLSDKVCADRLSELIPCLDRHLIYQTRLKLDLTVMEHYERHCPLPERWYNCLIHPPTRYKIPIKWPKSRDEVWKANIPHNHLATEKSDQNWMIVRGDKIAFPEEELVSITGLMLKIPNGNLNNMGRILTIVDVGCGVASFGGYLLSSDIIAMSLAPNDRGIPAYLGVLVTKRFPYRSRSFELAHCSRCRIDWIQRDGVLLLELDRLLRPGGHFAYSSPEAYAQDEEDLRIWREMSAPVERMRWKITAKGDQTVIWVKPLTNDCYMQREPGTQPPLCQPDDDPDVVWGVKMEACITPYSEHDHKASGSGLAPWPARLTSPPPRLVDFGYSSEMVENYWNLLIPKIKLDTLRNLMDMKANQGSFAAALRDRDVWVMTLQEKYPFSDVLKTSQIINKRHILSFVTYESHSTYPRTYDLLHAWSIFSDIEKKDFHIFYFIKKYLSALQWKAMATTKAERDSEQDEDEVVFIIQKKQGLTSESFRDTE
ncbi:hypothetical protein K2173_013677 [Erythroxylum novogranatense]|uniref:Methyltransferase n=1 Tax=Erythroxylum novogranatense TaxID=1862640 RepID=A0AAV8SAP2_9ROSI|nr:hypothetical protein K2173_013677 [Erythroxylum novogranatense]